MGHWEQISVKKIQNKTTDIHRNAFESVACKMAALLSGPRILVGQTYIVGDNIPAGINGEG